MKLRILAINWEIIHDTATNARFTDAPAFSDYDAVVIDPSEIYSLLVQHAAKRTPEGSLAVNIDGDQGHTRSLIKFMERRAGEVLALLHKTRGVILTKAVPMDDVLILKGYDSYRRPVDQGSLSIYSWLPQISRYIQVVDDLVKLFPRDGSVVETLSKKHPLAQYLTAFREEVRYSCVVVPQPAGGQNVEVIATDKVGTPIATDCSVHGGRVVFLPSFQPSDPSKAGGILVNVVRRLLGRSPHEAAPKWAVSYPVHGETLFHADLDAIEEKVSQLENVRAELMTRVERVKAFQVLLHGQGKYSLEPVVREAFRTLGFRVPEPEEYGEQYDLRLSCDEGEAIGEVEGVDDGPVGVEKYRQLLDYVDQELTNNNRRCKGILVGNGFRLTDPKDRPDQFTEPARRGCMANGFCMVATTELFRAVNVVLADQGNESLKARIRGKIQNAVGDWRLE